MKALLNELRGMGKTILVSSHILSELADFCTSIGIIERGKLLAAGSIQDIQRQLRTHRVLKVRVLDPSTDRAEAILRDDPAVSHGRAATTTPSRPSSMARTTPRPASSAGLCNRASRSSRSPRSR